MDADGRPDRIIDSLDAAHALLAPVFLRARDERLCVVHLNGELRLIGLKFRYADAGASVELPIRKIIADALALGTQSLILAHNHPSGDARPSSTDLAGTRSLVQVARPLGLFVRDHLIFGDGRFVSLRSEGLL
jgi:DNA repair protein RadC